MSLEKVYEFLENVEGGEDIKLLLKGEVDTMKDADARARISAKKEKEILEKYNQSKAILDKIQNSGIDLDKIEEYAKAGIEKSTLEQQVASLNSKVSAFQKMVEEERRDKERIETERKVEKIKNHYTSKLSGDFGKMAEILVENLVTKGRIKYDENGLPVYEDEKGLVYTDSESVDILKKSYSEYILPKGSGSGIAPRTGTKQRDEGIDVSKMTAAQKIEYGLKSLEQGEYEK